MENFSFNGVHLLLPSQFNLYDTQVTNYEITISPDSRSEISN